MQLKRILYPVLGLSQNVPFHLSCRIICAFKGNYISIFLHRPEGRCYGRIIFGFIYNKETFETAPRMIRVKLELRRSERISLHVKCSIRKRHRNIFNLKSRFVPVRCSSNEFYDPVLGLSQNMLIHFLDRIIFALKGNYISILLHLPEGRCYRRIIFGFIYNKVTFETAPSCNLLPLRGITSE